MLSIPTSKDVSVKLNNNKEDLCNFLKTTNFKPRKSVSMKKGGDFLFEDGSVQQLGKSFLVFATKKQKYFATALRHQRMVC